ncbi:MAG: hypothetical protein WCA12_20055 [Burkholderiales bacterium]
MSTITRPTLFDRLASFARFVFWGLLVFLLLRTMFAPDVVGQRRAAALASFEKARDSRVIALIHRADRANILGLPIGGSYINIDDSESVLRAIRLTPADKPIDLILHTPGGLVLAAEQIARALLEHPGKVTVFVPHYAMSGGTLVALAANEIVMDPNAVLGPVDPQLGNAPAASILKAVEQKPVERISDQTLILADVARKAQNQVREVVTELLAESKQVPHERAPELAKMLSEGRWTHDFPINVKTARSFGLNISTEMPRAVYEIMDLYPQAPSKRPSVIYLEPPEGARPGFPTVTPESTPVTPSAPAAPAPAAAPIPSKG